MLMGSFAFASNSNQTVVPETHKEYDTYSIDAAKFVGTPFGTCYVTIGFYDEDGNRIGGVVLEITDVDTQEQCNELADKIAHELKKMLD